MTWIKRHLALLVVIGALLDSAVFGVQGWQIHILNNQQTQISQQAHKVAVSQEAQNHASRKAECWARVLDHALADGPTITSPQHAVLLQEAQHCRHIPG